jgi:putative ABC transport system permease protein
VSAVALQPSRLPAADVLRVGAVGLRTRRLRAALSALGIAIGIASMVAVLGISQSSKADLLAQLDRLGTNLLTVAPGQSFFGANSTLPDTSVAAVRGLGDVSSAASTAGVSAATVRRSRYIDAQETNGISVLAADTGLLASLGGGMKSGRFLDSATERYPVVVLGAVAAARLGIGSLADGPQVWIAGSWWSVGGILAPQALAPDVDRSALMGYPVAKSRFGVKHNPSTIYVRTAQDRVTQAEAVLGRTANPEHADEVQVSRPSDAIEARAAAKSAFTALFLGLGAVALLVGGVGIANVMVISVLERRSEIGLRRALGATRRHVTAQFLTESLLLATLGGTAGVALGALVTSANAASQGWPIELPAVALGGGLGAAVAIGAIAGIYPAARAARLSPTEALRSA